jgi:hypothetical protein
MVPFIRNRIGSVPNGVVKWTVLPDTAFLSASPCSLELPASSAKAQFGSQCRQGDGHKSQSHF